MTKYGTLLLCFFTYSFYTVAQNPQVMNNWIFGWFTGLDFTSGSPVLFNGTGMMSEEGSVSYSDDQGNLLFYSNGGDDGGTSLGYSFGGVWNRNFEVMPNGDITGLAGCNSSPQSALVVPKSETEYYLFTIGCGGLPQGLRMSIVDMSLDGGLGDLSLVGQVLLNNSSTPLAEGMTGTRHANGTDVWLVVHSKTGTTFYTFLVSPSGVSSVNVQNVGSTLGNMGQIRFNLQGTKLAYNGEIFDFDNATGQISNPVNIGQADGWGRAFSPSGRYYYQNSASGGLYQFDMESADIAASKVSINDNMVHFYGGMQIGPDLKIYMTEMGVSGLNVITEPEMPGLACNYMPGGLSLGFGAVQLGLPNYIDGDLLSLLEVEDIEASADLRFYPNPAKDQVTFENLPESVEIAVCDVLGHPVQNWKMYGNKMDIGQLKPGVYFVRIADASFKLYKD